jgi:hypothetical protein
LQADGKILVGGGFTILGVGSRIPGGWQLNGPSLAPGATIRSRGHVTGGRFNGSIWFVETIAAPPAVLTGLASNITSSAVTLNGSVDPRGTATTFRFEYGMTTSYGASTPVTSVGDGTN